MKPHHYSSEHSGGQRGQTMKKGFENNTVLSPIIIATPEISLTMQRQTAVTAYLESKQLMLFGFPLQ